MIKFKKLHNDAIIPTRSDNGAAGFDLYAYSFEVCNDALPVRRCKLPQHTRITINTGIAMSIYPCTVGLIKPRSGLASKQGVDTMAGVIDSNYRGELKVILINHGCETVTLQDGMRVAQLIVTPIATDWEEVHYLDDTERGEKGFGSTGK